MSNWKIVVEPHGKNPGLVDKAKAAVGVTEPENTGGMIIYISNGNGFKEEVSRVSWIRRSSVCKNPKNSFSKQLGIEVEKAEASVKLLNDALAGAGTNQ